MQSMIQRRVRLGLSSISIAALAVTLIAGPAISAEDYSAPAAPTSIKVSKTTGGLWVQWAESDANPSVSNYIISAGVGSCPIIVSGSNNAAFLPALALVPHNVTVQAVNAYGISDKGSADSAITPTSLTSQSLKSVQILQLSDFHGALVESSSGMGAALLTSAWRDNRLDNPATFALSAGDNIGAAPPISAQFNEYPTIYALNGMGLDVSTMGNHEHDRDLAHLRQIILRSDFEWVASNYNTLLGMRIDSRVKAKPYTIVERAGVKLGVVGVNTDETAEVVFPGNLDFTWHGKEKETVITRNFAQVQARVNAAKSAGADAVVLLVHEGWNLNDDGKAVGPLLDWAAEIDGVAAVYGGHSHNTFAGVVDGVLTAQTRNAGVEYTKTQLCVNTYTNKVLGASVEHVVKADVNGLTRDGLVEAMVSNYADQAALKLDAKIGQVSTVAPRGGTPAVERSGEAALGSYIADAMLSKYNTDLVLINGGGIRDTFPAKNYVPKDTSLVRADAASGPYDVTLGDANTVLPFGNSIAIGDITGSDLWAALENGVSGYPSSGRFPQIAGFKFSFDPDLAVGSRITAVTDVNGTAIAKDSTVYSIATVDFLVYGGDGYTQFDASKVSIRDLLVDVFIDAIKADADAGKVTVMSTDGRITVE